MCVLQESEGITGVASLTTAVCKTQASKRYVESLLHTQILACLYRTCPMEGKKPVSFI